MPAQGSIMSIQSILNHPDMSSTEPTPSRNLSSSQEDDNQATELAHHRSPIIAESSNAENGTGSGTDQVIAPQTPVFFEPLDRPRPRPTPLDLSSPKLAGFRLGEQDDESPVLIVYTPSTQGAHVSPTKDQFSYLAPVLHYTFEPAKARTNKCDHCECRANTAAEVHICTLCGWTACRSCMQYRDDRYRSRWARVLNSVSVGGVWPGGWWHVMNIGAIPPEYVPSPSSVVHVVPGQEVRTLTGPVRNGAPEDNTGQGLGPLRRQHRRYQARRALENTIGSSATSGARSRRSQRTSTNTQSIPTLRSRQGSSRSIGRTAPVTGRGRNDQQQGRTESVNTSSSNGGVDLSGTPTNTKRVTLKVGPRLREAEISSGYSDNDSGEYIGPVSRTKIPAKIKKPRSVQLRRPSKRSLPLEIRVPKRGSWQFPKPGSVNPRDADADNLKDQENSAAERDGDTVAAESDDDYEQSASPQSSSEDAHRPRKRARHVRSSGTPREPETSSKASVDKGKGKMVDSAQEKRVVVPNTGASRKGRINQYNQARVTAIPAFDTGPTYQSAAMDSLTEASRQEAASTLASMRLVESSPGESGYDADVESRSRPTRNAYDPQTGGVLLGQQFPESVFAGPSVIQPAEQTAPSSTLPLPHLQGPPTTFSELSAHVRTTALPGMDLPTPTDVSREDEPMDLEEDFAHDI